MGKFDNEPFQIFFSGVESDSYFDIVTKETNAVLMSYLYIKSKPKKFMKERFAKRPDLRILIDSGAHTFLEDKRGEYANKGIDYWEKYIEGYVSFIRENKEHIFAAVELDIDSLVGTAKVEEWRTKYFEPLEAEGIQVIYVWHSIKGDAEWEKMCERYSFIGFSFREVSADFTIKKLSKMFNLAKKYKARIHGFAATGMDTISTYPFYTVDSTTWLVGTQFGEVNYFDGRKMTRLKKDKWKRQFKNKLIDLGANWTLAEREEPYELIRINVLTFLKVQAFIQGKMKAKAYWKGGKPVIKKKIEDVEPDGAKKYNEDVEDVIRLPRGTLPEAEWFSGEMEDFKSYCLSLGIDSRLEKEDAVNLIKTFFIFISYDKEALDKYSTEALFDFCDRFGLEGINTSKKAIEALPYCFKEHAEGKRNEFANYYDELNASEEEVREKPKEREEYVLEDSYTLIDIPKEQCDSILSQFLPEADLEMPEVEAYDEKLSEMAIIPVRDANGRFIKGQKKVRKPKMIYSDKMHKLACDTCYAADKCPDYRAGYVCAYDKEFKKFNTRNVDDVMDAMYGMIEYNLGRFQRMAMFETMDGGMIDGNVNVLMEMNMKYLQKLVELQNHGRQIVAQERVVVDSNTGKTEVVKTVTANPQQGGILSQIFGGFDKSNDNTINVTAKKVEDSED